MIAEFEAFRINPDAKLSEVKIHRTKEMIPPNRLGPITFPLAEFRLKQTREINDDPDATAYDPWRPKSSLAKGPSPVKGQRVKLSTDDAYDHTLVRLGLHMSTQLFGQVFIFLKTKKSR